MQYPTILEMLQAGVHFGHQMSRWHPKMKPFIFSERNRIHVIDLEKTEEQLKLVLPAIKQMASDGKTILFVTTKPQARDIVKNSAIECGMPYLVERWLGGLLTNFGEIRKLLRKYITLKEKQAKGELEHYTKKEQLEIARELEKMDSYLAGLTSLTRMPDVLFIPSVQREKTAMVEANKMGVPVIGICDTNSNPDKVEYVIPGNDDAVKSVTLLVRLVTGAIKEGSADKEIKVQTEPVIQTAPVLEDNSNNI